MAAAHAHVQRRLAGWCGRPRPPANAVAFAGEAGRAAGLAGPTAPSSSARRSGGPGSRSGAGTRPRLRRRWSSPCSSARGPALHRVSPAKKRSAAPAGSAPAAWRRARTASRPARAAAAAPRSSPPACGRARVRRSQCLVGQMGQARPAPRCRSRLRAAACAHQWPHRLSARRSPLAARPVRAAIRALPVPFLPCRHGRWARHR